MGQVFSCLRDHCPKLGRKRKLSEESESSQVASLDVSTEDANKCYVDQRVILVEEQDDPDERNRAVGGVANSSAIAHEDHIYSNHLACNEATLVDIEVVPKDHLIDNLESSCPKKIEKFPDQTVSVKKIKTEDFQDFPIIKDQNTIDYVLKSKIAVIMRGLSGSGKSTLASKLLEIYGDYAIECSADFFFNQPDGSYAFDPTLLKEAHNFCYETAKHEMSVVHRPLVIINNTNIKLWEYKKYTNLAKDYCYTVIIMEPQTPWAQDPEILAQKNIHGNEASSIANRLAQYQANEPIFFGWFLNPHDSCILVNQVFDYLKELLNVSPFRESLVRCCTLTVPNFVKVSEAEAHEYYRFTGRDGAFQSLHCTAMFMGKGKAPGAQEYLKRPAVKKNIGRVYSLIVTGFVITPRTLGARVLLQPPLLPLWGQQDDGLDMPDALASLYRAAQPDQRVLLPNGRELLLSGSELGSAAGDLSQGSFTGNLSPSTAGDLSLPKKDKYSGVSIKSSRAGNLSSNSAIAELSAFSNTTMAVNESSPVANDKTATAKDRSPLAGVESLSEGTSPPNDIAGITETEVMARILQRASSKPRLCDDEGSLKTLVDISCDQVPQPAQDETGEGRRAHLTLAVAPNVAAVVTGFDLLQLLRLESEIREVLPRSVKIKGGVITEYEGGVFAVKPDQCMKVQAMFSASY
ncbi:uncharacterized protein LOC108681948 [Hyalella azteca]|uniref:2',3'-cyclic-nucleotide 3'-phosphodiesterase n=1 Tax=Hyalella azteca TaxID=294128 RepID=A0A8B7PK29_HYAAZ|nr:uncharacterized protein LOC108681948 [Hyalella azteca]